MSAISIEAEKLGKRYRIGAPARHNTLRDALAARFKTSGSRARGQPTEGRSSSEAFVWALRDASLCVRKGDVVGVIGSNGAGKTTLLKLLARITQPTEGHAVVRGRVASLLEVGTGFHPELSGRENVYLNGAILGMRKREIDRKFEEIVAFAEVDRFVDTPLKHYSSGMAVRLAFAVAAHLEPEVLLVDEVLAVGDAGFQRKSLGRMQDVAREGRTVVFVSHNMAAVRSLCRHALLLEQGRVVSEGPVGNVVQSYLAQFAAPAGAFDARRRRQHAQSVRIQSAATLKEGLPCADFDYGDELDLRVTVAAEWSDTVGLEVTIRDGLETALIFLPSGLRFGREFRLARGPNTIRCRIPSLPLAEGRYSIDLAVVHSGVETLDHVESGLVFHVVLCDPLGVGKAYRQSSGQGSVHIPADFEMLDTTATVVSPPTMY